MESFDMEQAMALYNKVDSVVSDAVFAGLKSVGMPIKEWGISPITADLPCVASPTPLLLWIAFYIIVVTLGLALAPAAKPSTEAKPQDPFLLRAFVQLHNVFLIALSSYMFGGSIYEAWMNGYNFWGNGYDASQVGMGRVIYVFYMSKWYEFFDTFIMLAKGNYKQVSFLHTYHHVSISLIWWIIAYVAPGGDAYYSCFLNSLVHIIMYTYYFVAAMVGKDPKVRRKYLWWGQYLTMFQMGQFVSMMVQAWYVLRYSPYPKEMAQLLFYYMQTLLVLFGHFFVRKYMSGGNKKSSKAKKTK